MSTEHQQYSTVNQDDTIQAYAENRNFEIVRTVADEGKSGLNVAGRQALQRLIEDVQNGNADFEAILVYDISRWGAFKMQTKVLTTSTYVSELVSQSTIVLNSSRMNDPAYLRSIRCAWRFGIQNR